MPEINVPVYIHRPHTVFPAHKITTDEIIDDILTRHPAHPRRASLARVINSLRVETRHFTRPLASPTVAGDGNIEQRTRTAFEDALEMATAAAERALDSAQLTHGPDGHPDIDAIITTHSSSWCFPNLDVHLVTALGLRPTVRRTALTTAGCAGGAQALIRAAGHVAAHPGSKVLVVAAEVISSLYNHNDTAIEAMIYKALFGDSAAACVVTDTPLGPGFTIDGPEDTLEYLLPDSVNRYSTRIGADSLHFESTKAALSAAGDALPALIDWIGHRRIVDWAVIHPGSPRVILDTANALGLDECDARHSTASLADEGNLGGVSILRVLDRTHADPPPAGAVGVLVAYGPGFATAALRGTWRS
ncbi:PhlD [Streptomyces sp. NPDC004787]|uniref:PhlD n=1 Tax=Streptomyces sp. NPDC004787 TaxID=3154291 RepID=UPI0033ABD33F